MVHIIAPALFAKSPKETKVFANLRRRYLELVGQFPGAHYQLVGLLEVDKATKINWESGDNHLGYSSSGQSLAPP